MFITHRGRFTGWMHMCYESSKSNSSDFIHEYANHIIEVLSVLNKYNVFTLSSYRLNYEEYALKPSDTHSHGFWIKILNKKTEYSTLDIEFLGKTMVYESGKQVWLENAIELSTSFNIRKYYICFHLATNSDNWFPYYFINEAKVNCDYKNNASRLEMALTEFFINKYQYETSYNEVSGIYSLQSGFRLNNLYSDYGELNIVDERGCVVDFVHPKLLR